MNPEEEAMKAALVIVYDIIHRKQRSSNGVIKKKPEFAPFEGTRPLWERMSPEKYQDLCNGIATTYSYVCRHLPDGQLVCNASASNLACNMADALWVVVSVVGKDYAKGDRTKLNETLRQVKLWEKEDLDVAFFNAKIEESYDSDVTVLESDSDEDDLY